MVAIGIVVALFNYLYLLHVSFIVYPPKEIKRPPTWPSICNNFCSKRMPGMWVMNSKTLSGMVRLNSLLQHLDKTES